MTEEIISEKIHYIPASFAPLSADVGIVYEAGQTWLFDVGSSADAAAMLPEGCHAVISHFHQDHTGNLERVAPEELYVSKETFAHTHRGTVVQAELTVGGLHIFPLPSSHAKGCLGLEVDGTYVFVGDALYGKEKDGCLVFNATLLKDEIDVLRGLQARWVLESHHMGDVRPKAEVLAELEAIYRLRQKNNPEIRMVRNDPGGEN